MGDLGDRLHDRRGHGRVVAELPAQRDRLASVAVTRERPRGAQQHLVPFVTGKGSSGAEDGIEGAGGVADFRTGLEERVERREIGRVLCEHPLPGHHRSRQIVERVPPDLGDRAEQPAPSIRRRRVRPSPVVASEAVGAAVARGQQAIAALEPLGRRWVGLERSAEGGHRARLVLAVQEPNLPQSLVAIRSLVQRLEVDGGSEHTAKRLPVGGLLEPGEQTGVDLGILLPRRDEPGDGLVGHG